MKVMTLRAPAGLDMLHLEDHADPGQPGPGMIRVALHGSSLNFHDLGVVTGQIPTAANRVPLADGAGTVEQIGDGVTDFAVGDLVVSCFFPDWHTGAPTLGDFSRTPIAPNTQPVTPIPALPCSDRPARWAPRW